MYLEELEQELPEVGGGALPRLALGRLQPAPVLWPPRRHGLLLALHLERVGGRRGEAGEGGEGGRGLLDLEGGRRGGPE